MERGLALAIFIVVSLDIVIAKLLSKAGVIDQRGDWHQYVAAHSTLWLILVPLVYAGLCEMARGRNSPAILLTITRALGFVLLAVFLIILACFCFG
jgi:hypothetical protein